jgi:hypothetical protein
MARLSGDSGVERHWRNTSNGEWLGVRWATVGGLRTYYPANGARWIMFANTGFFGFTN